MFDKVKAWALKNPRVALFAAAIIVFLVYGVATAAQFHGFVQKGDTRYFVFSHEGEIVHCINNPGADRVNCKTLQGQKLSCANLQPEQGFIGGCVARD